MVDFVFNLINFVVIIALSLIFLNKKILPKLKKGFYKEQKFLEDLILEKKALIIAQDETETSIKEQKLECEKLKKKIDEWNQKVEDSKKLKEEEQKKYWKDLKNKLEIQSKNFNLLTIKKTIEKEVIKGIKKDLLKYFSDSTNMDKYMNFIINQMDKNGK